MKSYKILEKKEFAEAAALFTIKPDIVFFVSSLDGTKEISKIILNILKPGMFVGLSGQLGAGKTEFIRCLLNNLGFIQGVLSPSFVLEAEYQIAANAPKNKGISVVSHWDLYRLKQVNPPPELLEKQNLNDTLTLVEWPEKIPMIRDLLSLEVMLAIPDVSFEEADFSGEERVIAVKFYKQRLLKEIISLIK